MYCMPRAQGCAGAAHVQDVRVENCSLHFRHFRHPWRSYPRAQDDIQGCISVAKSRMLGATAQERRMYRMYGTILVIGDW